MGLGRAVEVNLGKYFDVLSKVYDPSKVNELKGAFRDYGIEDSATIYSGEKGDGEVIIRYALTDDSGKEAISGVLRFCNNGKIYEGLRGKTVSVEADDKLAKMFIYGLFGAEEMMYGVDGAAQIALDSARGCWIDGGGQCNLAVEKSSRVGSSDSQIEQHVETWAERKEREEKEERERWKKTEECQQKGYDYWNGSTCQRAPALHQ